MLLPDRFLFDCAEFLCGHLPCAKEVATDELATYLVTIDCSSKQADLFAAVELLCAKVKEDLADGRFTRYVRWSGVTEAGFKWAQAERADHLAIGVVTSQYQIGKPDPLITFAVYGR